MLPVFFNAVSAVVVLLLLMAVGYLLGYLKWMGGGEKKFLGKYLINIAVPCNILSGILNNLDRSMLSEAVSMLSNCMLGVVLNFAIGMLVATVLRLPKNRWGVFVCMLALPNSLFIGLPMCTQLFGDISIPYVMIYYLSNTIFTQSVAGRAPDAAGSGDQAAHRGHGGEPYAAGGGDPSSCLCNVLCQVYQWLCVSVGADLLRFYRI